MHRHYFSVKPVRCSPTNAVAAPEYRSYVKLQAANKTYLLSYSRNVLQ